ncbi:MAG: ankyrin repeat domain-containing protein [Kiritimatiellae bacterium]|nr:ankyrin repeat domain-containing protein [Kiritimatiellia bacterium]
MDIVVPIVIFLVICSIAAFWAAAMKRRWWVWFLIALFLTPLVAFIGLIIVFFTSGQPRRIGRAVKRGVQSSYGAVADYFPGESPIDDQNRELYTRAGSEIASKTYDQALFTKAFSDADGDENKAKAFYIRYRVIELRQQRKEAEEAAEKQRQEKEFQKRKKDEEIAEEQRKKAEQQRQEELLRQQEEWRRKRKEAEERRKAEGKLPWYVWKLIFGAAGVIALIVIIVPNQMRWEDERRQAEYRQRHALVRQEQIRKEEQERQEQIRNEEQARQEQIRKEEQARKEEQERRAANVIDKDGMTPLMKAVRINNLDAVKYLIAKGADVNVRDYKFGWTPLMWAAHNGRLDIIKFLVDKGADINTKNKIGTTPLVLAVRTDNLVVDVVKFLIDKGADVNVRDYKFGWTPLILAVGRGRLDIAQLLVENGADTNTMDGDGMTPLMKAAKNDDLDAVKYLIAKGADINAKSNFGTTALHLCTYHGHRHLADFLRQHGAKE